MKNYCAPRCDKRQRKAHSRILRPEYRYERFSDERECEPTTAAKMVRDQPPRRPKHRKIPLTENRKAALVEFLREKIEAIKQMDVILKTGGRLPSMGI